MSEVNKGNKYPLGYKHTEESKLKNWLSQPTRKKIEVTNLELNTSTLYNYMGAAAIRNIICIDHNSNNNSLIVNNSYLFEPPSPKSGFIYDLDLDCGIFKPHSLFANNQSSWSQNNF